MFYDFNAAFINLTLFFIIAHCFLSFSSLSFITEIRIFIKVTLLRCYNDYHADFIIVARILSFSCCLYHRPTAFTISHCFYHCDAVFIITTLLLPLSHCLFIGTLIFSLPRYFWSGDRLLFMISTLFYYSNVCINVMLFLALSHSFYRSQNRQKNKLAQRLYCYSLCRSRRNSMRIF